MIDSSLGQSFFFIFCDTHSDLCTRVDHISQSRDVFEVPSPWERFQWVVDRPCTENINVFALEFFKISFFTLKLVKKKIDRFIWMFGLKFLCNIIIKQQLNRLVIIKTALFFRSDLRNNLLWDWFFVDFFVNVSVRDKVAKQPITLWA